MTLSEECQERVFDDRYRTVCPLVRTGPLQVYLARDTELDRLVRVEVLWPVDAATGEAFLDAARAGARLVHPNIASVYDIGLVDNGYFSVHEHVPGVTLEEVLQAGRLRPERAAAVGADVAEALTYAHERGITHGHLRTSDVLLDEADRVKVVGFGSHLANQAAVREDVQALGAVLRRMAGPHPQGGADRLDRIGQAALDAGEGPPPVRGWNGE